MLQDIAAWIAANVTAHLPHGLPVNCMAVALCTWCGAHAYVWVGCASPGLCAKVRKQAVVGHGQDM